MSQDVKPSQANLSDLTMEVRLLGATVNHVNEKITEFMHDTKKLQEIVYHLDKTSATKKDLEKVHERIDGIQDSQADNWKRIMWYILISSATGGATGATFDTARLLIGG